MALIISQESMNKGARTSLTWSKRSIIPELEGGRAHGFAKGNHHKD
jgi:hypothetical protein